jgi:hypothetical protein
MLNSTYYLYVHVKFEGACLYEYVLHCVEYNRHPKYKSIQEYGMTISSNKNIRARACSQ